ncbi:50S ribosomal protein L4 [bacterium]|nr:50S ribosomal protein L4 [bacterium]
MPKLDLHNIEGKRIGELSLSSKVFGTKVNEALLYEVVRRGLASRRRGTASTKERSQVRGGGRKPWRQKGTGRARAGSIRSPIWKGGGTTFGPHPRDYSYSLSKKARRKSLRCALSAKFKEKKILILDRMDLKEAKTKRMVNILTKLRSGKTPLLIVEEKNEMVRRSARNIEGVKVLSPNSLNVYDLLNHDRLILTKEALTRLEENLG